MKTIALDVLWNEEGEQEEERTGSQSKLRLRSTSVAAGPRSAHDGRVGNFLGLGYARLGGRRPHKDDGVDVLADA